MILETLYSPEAVAELKGCDTDTVIRAVRREGPGSLPGFLVVNSKGRTVAIAVSRHYLDSWEPRKYTPRKRKAKAAKRRRKTTRAKGGRTQ